MNPEEALEHAIRIAQKQGASQIDGAVVLAAEEDVEVYAGEISKAEVSSSLSCGVRLVHEGKPGYAFTQKLSLESIQNMVKDAIHHAEISSPCHFKLQDPAEAPDVDLKKFNPKLENLSMVDMKHLALDLESEARSLDEHIVNVPHAGVNKGMSSSIYHNHLGQWVKKQSNSVTAYCGAVAQLGEQKKSGSFGDGARSWQDLKSVAIAKTAVERSVELLGARPIESGRYPIVFSNRISASIIGMYLSNLSAEQVQKGQSRWKGKCGTAVANENITLECLPHLVSQPGSRLYDSEGIVCRDTPLIEKGILKTYIHNLESAAIDGVTPTGHGSRGTKGKASVSFSNLHLKKGHQSLDELLNQAPKCLYVTKLEGGAACSAISGELSIGVQGFLVENGQKVHPVDSVTVSGNFFDFLHQVVAVSNEVQPTFNSYKFPDLMIDGLSVSG